MRYSLSVLAVLALLGIFLAFFGCTADQAKATEPSGAATQSPAIQTSPGNQPAAKGAATNTPANSAHELPPSEGGAISTQTATGGCTSPYEGTYQGALTNSGKIEVDRPDSSGQYHRTENPFLQTYDFEMKIKCEQLAKDENGRVAGTVFRITHAKVTHPLFGCTAGCIPMWNATDSFGSTVYSEVFLNNDLTGNMLVMYPNEAVVSFGNGHGESNRADDVDSTLTASQDAKRITLTITGKYWFTIGALNSPNNDDVQLVETQNCKQLGGAGDCFLLGAADPATMTLYKVS